LFIICGTQQPSPSLFSQNSPGRRMSANHRGCVKTGTPRQITKYQPKDESLCESSLSGRRDIGSIIAYWRRPFEFPHSLHPTEPLSTGIANGRCGATLAASGRLDHRQLGAESSRSRCDSSRRVPTASLGAKQLVRQGSAKHLKRAQVGGGGTGTGSPYLSCRDHRAAWWLGPNTGAISRAARQH